MFESDGDAETPFDMTIQVAMDKLLIVIGKIFTLFTENYFFLILTSVRFFQCIRNVYTSKIISSDRDLLSVVFYGTENSKNSADFKHIYVLQELDNPGKMVGRLCKKIE